MELDRISLSYLKEAYDEVKLVFATKNHKKLEFLMDFYIEYRTKKDSKLDKKRWSKFLIQKYKERMRNMAIFEYNFKEFKDLKMYIISKNIVVLRAKDGDAILGDRFLYFHRDSMGTWAWCQNSDIIDFEDPKIIDEIALYEYKNDL